MLSTAIKWTKVSRLDTFKKIVNYFKGATEIKWLMMWNHLRMQIWALINCLEMSECVTFRVMDHCWVWWWDIIERKEQNTIISLSSAAIKRPRVSRRVTFKKVVKGLKSKNVCLLIEDSELLSISLFAQVKSYQVSERDTSSKEDYLRKVTVIGCFNNLNN